MKKLLLLALLLCTGVWAQQPYKIGTLQVQNSTSTPAANTAVNANYYPVITAGTGANVLGTSSLFSVNPSTGNITANHLFGSADSASLANYLYTTATSGAAPIQYSMAFIGPAISLPNYAGYYADNNVTWEPFNKTLAFPNSTRILTGGTGTFDGSSAFAGTANNINVLSTASGSYNLIFSTPGSTSFLWTTSTLTFNAAATGGMGITTTGSGSSLSITDTGTNGAIAALMGNGGTTPNKYLRAYNGGFQIVNSAFSAAIMNLSDAGALQVPSYDDNGGHLITSSTAPTISSGFGTSPSITANNTAGFAVTVGTGPGTTGTLALPSASSGWACHAENITHSATLTVGQSAVSTSSVTFTSYSRTTGLATAFTASDLLAISCSAY